MSSPWCNVAAARYDAWEALACLVNEYAVAKYGRRAVAVTIHLDGGEKAKEPLPAIMPPPGPPSQPLRMAWASGPHPKEEGGCRRVYWPGLGEFHFGPKQARAVALLWGAWKDGSHEVPEKELLKAAGSDGGRLRDLFRSQPAWRSLVVRGAGDAAFRLAREEEEDEDEE